MKRVGQTVTTNARGYGNWMIYLEPMPARNSPSDTVITGNNVLTITDVQTSEVWLGQGQSNMQRSLSDDSDADAALPGGGGVR